MSSYSISCHSGFLVQISGFNKTNIFDIINKRDLMWYSCWKPLNTKHKFIYKSNFNKKIKLKSIFKQIINTSERFKWLILLRSYPVTWIGRLNQKTSYSLTGIDLIVDYIFKKENGIYIDVGCNHPIYSNNTYLLNRKGWHGINIDIDEKSINLFNLFRKNDLNINLAVSSKQTELEYINFHEKSPINKIKTDFNKNLHPLEKIKKIKSDTLDSIIENSKYKDKKIDFVSIDVEGHEIEVIKGFNLKKYKPSIIVIEYLDTSLKTIEIKNFNLKI